MTITTRSDFNVQLVDSMGGDSSICKAARVSTLGVASLETMEAAGLINFLLKNRHGSPFEHGAMTYLIEAPIFVWREFMRHRIGFSYNETSGRYKELEPDFYVPSKERPLVQVGKPGAYELVASDDPEVYSKSTMWIKVAYRASWLVYKTLLKFGIAKEVARIVLPVGIFSAAYVTCNPRSLMNFLSLRTKDERATVPSFPQWEIEQVALKMEGEFAKLYPLTYEAFNKNGRQAP